MRQALCTSSITSQRPPLGIVLLLALAALLGAPALAAAADPLVQQISSDPLSNPESQHATEVEPDSFAFGDTVIAAFQVGRYVSQGGASSTGYATSKDGGKSWTSGILPSLTVNSSPAGMYNRTSDPTVAYDAVHAKWLIVSLALKEPCTGDCQTAVVVSTSSDGLTWGAPVTIAPLVGSLAYDKEWVVCDNGATSPRRGACYTSYSDFTNGRRIVTSHSTDGGLSWSGAVGSPDATASGLGAQPVVQPDGTLVVVFLAGDTENGIGAIRSTDGGVTFGSMVTIPGVARFPNQFAPLPILPHSPLRGRSLPTVETDGNGVLFAAWDDCRFSTGCAANDIVLATSSDGLAWSTPARIPVDPVGSNVDHIVPGLGVDATTTGATARLALTYHYFSTTGCTLATCQLRVGFVSSNDAGASWSVPIELSNGPMSLSWLSDTSQGRMVGDYISTSFVTGGAAVAVFPLARAASSGFDQAMFSARIGVAPPPPPPSGGSGGSGGGSSGPAVTPPVAVPDPLPTPIPTQPVRALLVSSFAALPAVPLTGRAFTLRLRVRLGTTGEPLISGAAICSARIGTSSLRVVRRTLSAGLATCTWRIPTSATGKSLRASVGASRGTRTVHVARSFRIA
jgi:hypothetical protein